MKNRPCRRPPLGPAPDADQQQRRHERDFEKEVEQQPVGRDERAAQGPEQHENPRVIVLRRRVARDGVAGRDEHEQGDERRQQQQPRADRIARQVEREPDLSDGQELAGPVPPTSPVPRG
jgi:hypothetical protein